MDYQFLINTMLFSGMSADEARCILSCLDAREKRYKKGDIIFHTGDSIDCMGFILSGSVDIIIDDMWGNSTILGRADEGELFAETYACISGEPLMVDVAANEKCEILFLNAQKLMRTCKNACQFHNRLIQNLLSIFAVKNLELSKRSVFTSSRSIRARLISYLSEQSRHSGSYQFTIPFNRQQLADYLGVDRSALSNELSKMQNEGILHYEKNAFVLIRQ